MSANMPIEISLGCRIIGLNNVNAFSIDIMSSKTVHHLKSAIKEYNGNKLENIDADQLEIWKVSDPAQRNRHYWCDTLAALGTPGESRYRQNTWEDWRWRRSP